MQATTREKIMKILKETDQPLTPSEICVRAGLKPNDEYLVLVHIQHIAKTIRRSSGGDLHVLMQPPLCKACGYVFLKKEKPRHPSRCPRCGAERIGPPRFLVE